MDHIVCRKLQNSFSNMPVENRCECGELPTAHDVGLNDRRFVVMLHGSPIYSSDEQSDAIRVSNQWDGSIVRDQLPVVSRIDSTLTSLTPAELVKLQDMIISAISHQPAWWSARFDRQTAYELRVLNWDINNDLASRTHLYDEWFSGVAV